MQKQSRILVHWDGARCQNKASYCDNLHLMKEDKSLPSQSSQGRALNLRRYNREKLSSRHPAGQGNKYLVRVLTPG